MFGIGKEKRRKKLQLAVALYSRIPGVLKGKLLSRCLVRDA